MGFVRRGLQWLLAAVFLMSGLNKVTDVVHADTHKFLSEEAPKWGKVWKPLYDDVAKSIDEPTSKQVYNALLDDGKGSFKIFMRNIGILEITCAISLLLNTFSSLGAFILALIMAGGAYTHTAMKDNQAAVPGVLCSLCIILLLLPSGSASPKPKSAAASKKGKDS